ncbi:MAG: C25 family cysteine peptidase [Candidatus Cloacimonadota bacterium]|nr:C25 family cysteine peptidase [Candidatus Cloacimonadota bacterium]
MKKTIFIIIIFSTFTLFSLELNYMPQQISITGNFELKQQEVKIEGKTFLELTADGCFSSAGSNSYQIPRFTKLVRLPNVGNWQVVEKEIQTEEERVDFPLVCGYEATLTEPNNKEDRWLPEKVVQISKPFIMRGIRFAQISLAVCQYNPAQQKIRLIKNVDINLQIDEKNNTNVLKKQMKTNSEIFSKLATNHIIGYSKTKSQKRGSYLFICTNNVESHLQELKTWKQQLGYNVKIATISETGSTNNEIKDYLQNAYDNWENPPENVILFGDVSGNYVVPSFYVEGGSFSDYDVSDHVYTLLDGDDFFPDIMIGRVSFHNLMQLLTVVNKIIKYEKEPFTETNWFSKAINVGGISPQNDNYSPAETLWEAGRKLLDFNYESVYDFIYPYQTSVSELTDNINEGASIINFRGCGSYDQWSSYDGFTIFRSEDILQLHNGYKLPLITSISCGGGNFAVEVVPSCFGELWLNAGNPIEPKGAIGFIGPSEADTKTAWNNCNDLGIYQGFTQEDIFSCAGLMLRGKMELVYNYPDALEWGGPSNSAQFYFFVYNLLGDPGLKINSQLPQDFQLNTPEIIPANQNFLPISIETEQEKADFTVSITNSDSLIATAKTDIEGNANLQIPTEITEFIITASKFGYVPQITECSRQEEEYLQLIEYSFFSSVTNNSENKLCFSLKNNNENAITNITIELEDDENYFQIISDPIQIGAIEPNVVYTDSLYVQTDKLWQEAEEKQLMLQVDSDFSQQEFLVQTTVSSPDLNYISFQSSSEYLQPNSICNINLELENNGSVETAPFVAQLISHSTGSEVLQNTASYSSILPASSSIAEEEFQIQLYDVFPGNTVNFALEIWQTEEIVHQLQFSLPVGMVSPTSPTFSSYGYCAIESRDAGNFDIPAYNWIEIDPEQGGIGTLMEPDYSTSDAAIKTLGLPFTVNYFNRTYDFITICSQGWLSMGVCEQVFHRNKIIPSGNGPHSMVAPFWDEMGNGKVHYLYDSENNQFIVQWSNWVNYGGNQNTFQAIIFDPDYYQTPTGDAKILFQYKEIHNIDQENNYATVGIENYLENDGINLSYANRTPDSAHPLESETAILFTVAPYSDIPFLTVNPQEVELNMQQNSTEEFSLELSNESVYGNPINFHIESSHFIKKDKTRELKDIGNDQIIRGNNGYIPGQTMCLMLYLVHNVNSEPVHGVTMNFPSGFDVLDASAIEGLLYNGESGDGALISWGFGNGDNINQAGVHSFQVEFIPDLDMDETIEVSWYLEGDGSGSEPHSTSGSIFIEPTSSSYIWLQYPNGGEHLIATTQDTVRWDYYGDCENLDLFLRSENDGEWQLIAENIPNSGEYIFEVPAIVSDNCKMKLETDNAVDISMNPFTISALDIVYPTAQTVMQYNTQDSLKWLNLAEIENVNIEFSADNGLTWQELANGVQNTGSHYFQVPGPISEFCRLKIIDPESGLMNKTQNVFQVVDTPVEWLEANTNSGSVFPASSIIIDFTVNSENLETGEYEAFLKIVSSNGRILTIPVSLHVASSSNEEQIPNLISLEQNYPNPFRSMTVRGNTKIKFNISYPQKVELKIYNSRGRLVRTLLSQKIAAGEHEIEWNGKNEKNIDVSSGVYLYRLHAERKNITKKMILIK